MYGEFTTTSLRDGSEATLAVVQGPDTEWADRIAPFLGHKESIWNWQNGVILREECGIEGRYYLLHRDGDPFANAAIFERNGVGIFGHVFTNEDRRGLGAASLLTSTCIRDFADRGGKALSLGTGFDSPPYHIYRRHGFEGIEDGSGQMVHFPDSRDSFSAEFFDPGDTEISAPDWSDWPLSWPLMEAPVPGILRNMRMGLFGRSNTEGAMLVTVHDALSAPPERPPTCLVLRNRSSGAVLAIASWSWHRTWPQSCVLDVFAHPSAWEAAAELLAQLELPDAERTLAYVDEQTPEKASLLESAGFHAGPTWKRRVAANAARTLFVDVTEYAK